MNRVELKEWFERLFVHTQEFLAAQDEEAIHRVNLSEVLPDFWDEWFDPVLEVWSPETRRELCAFFLDEMAANPDDIAVRYSALAVYDGLIQYLSSSPWSDKKLAPSIRPFCENTIGDAPTPGKKTIEITRWMAHADLLREDLRFILQFVPVRSITSWRDIQWEISNACLIEDWERAFCLYQRAEELGVVSDVHLRLMLGQFQFLLAFRDTCLGSLQGRVLEDKCFYLRKRDYPFHPANWEPEPYEVPNSFGGLLFFASGLDVSSEESGATAPDPGILVEAIDRLESAGKLFRLPPPHQAALARCYFCAGRFNEAAMAYERLLEDELGGIWSPLFTHVYRAVASSYIASNETVKAIGTYQRCSCKFPDECDIYEATAKLQAQMADFAGAYETALRCIDKNPEYDNDWKLSTILALGGIRDVPHRGALADLKTEPVTRDGIVGLLSNYWAPFSKLDVKAREYWISGTYLLNFLPAQNRIPFERLAILELIKAVDAELDHKLFRPVREHFVRDKEVHKLITNRPERELANESERTSNLFYRFVDGRYNLGIGQKSAILSACQLPVSDEFKALKVWLDQHFPPVLAQTESLKRVSRFRNTAEHEGRLIETSEFIATACRTLIQAVSGVNYFCGPQF